MLGLCLNRFHLASVLSLVGLMGLLSCGKTNDSTLVCPPPGDICYDSGGNAFAPDGAPIDTSQDNNPIGDGDGSSTDDGDGGDGGDDDVVTPGQVCDCSANPQANDLDRDCIEDSKETVSDPTKKDTDGDGVNDGCEDRNFNGTVDAGESNPSLTDTDGDCIPDGVEDKNKNGRFEINLGESSPVLVDSDRDGIDDGGPSGEDKDCDGVVDVFVDNGTVNGCWDLGEPQGETNPANNDSDGDGIGDGREDANQNGLCDTGENSCAFVGDTDCDGVPDGAEDKNRNGAFNTGETNPRNGDSDGDGILDGTEDTNHNGIFESGTETDARNIDTDGDGLNDGVEDANHDGVVAAPPRGPDGCWTGAAQGETDPRRADSDGDHITDGVEDKNKNSVCDSGTIIDPNAPGGTREGLTESCAFLADTDCDGLNDDIEDKNRDGSYQLSETDARFNDTDRDGLIDGCPIGFDFRSCEDITNNGRVDLGETDPRSVDTDLDGLTDRCEVQFDASNCTSPSCITNATVEDTDGDGKTDGEEDANHNCRYEPNLSETDPRVSNPPPAVGTPEYPRSQVCDAQNLKQLTFAEAPDTAVDYRVAFEVEKFNGATADYSQRAFGIELANANNNIIEDDPNDMVWGHIFESPIGVVREGADPVINRNVYGFTYATQDTTPLDITLDGLRDRLAAAYGATVVVEVSNLPARPAHDNLPNFRVSRASRQYRITVSSSPSNAKAGVFVRQDLMARVFLPSDELANIRPTSVLADTTTDPVYGQVTCPGSPQCYQRFTMDIAAVQRLDQVIVPGATPATDVRGLTLYVVALTPDDSTTNPNDTVTRLYQERLTRLDDLTGGSAVARFEARRSSTCEDRNARQAKADLLFVVDDSASMQAIIDKLQQASRDAQAVLTANSNSVDYRVAMTTTNPSRYGRELCANGVNGTAPSGTFDPNIGCMKICPGTCTDGCVGGGCTGCIGDCDTSITDLLNREQGTSGNDGNPFQYALPGGGGTFYYEDTAWLDCDGTVLGANPCTDPDFAPFYAGGTTRKRLLDNAGFIGAAPSATCATSVVDLAAKTSNVGTTCDTNPNTPDCCDRLIDACTDGPRVLSSQMCDLIRSMGGRRESLGQTPSARPNSSNESGIRMARKLVQSMMNAQPSNSVTKDKLRLDCNPAGSLEACDTDSDCGSYDFCDRSVLTDNRGICKPTGNCQVCDPRAGTSTMVGNNIDFFDDVPAEIAGASCTPGPCACAGDSECGRGERCGRGGTCIVDCSPVPLVTIFLSDEEDFFFKDECSTTTIPPGTNWQQTAEAAADHSQLTVDCYYRIANPDANGNEQAEPCFDPDDVQPLAYCSGKYATGTNFMDVPDGYTPDAVPFSSIELMQWRLSGAPECAYKAPSPANPPLDTCVADPCRLLNQAACTAGNTNSQCVFNATANLCVNLCTNITIGGSSGLSQRTAQRDTCNANPACTFDAGLGVHAFANPGAADNSVTRQDYACVPKVPLNDCQACKRLKRRYQSALGGDTSENGTYTDLVGLGDVGPVYAIARDRGKEGFRLEGSALGQDQCAGGYITWGRGDGQGYRDVATDTFGRAQNVCASSYQDFMQLVVTDIVALSAPYKLEQSPIAATIKVGIGRPSGGGVWQYIEVPRSKTRGFVYDATSNSLGFKSDPVDGYCPSASCSVNGIIEQSEIDAARNAIEVPRANDLVFISYRFWRPVPCPEGCDPGDTCVRTLCPSDTGGAPPACADSSTCVGGRTCVDNQCVFDCTDDGYLERCVPNPCGECQTYNEATGGCTTITDTCICQTGNGIACDPTGPNTCPPGLACDESCTCLPITGCEGGFAGDGSVLDCDKALDCCIALSRCFDHADLATCNVDGNCSWNGTQCDPNAGSCCGRGEVAICFAPIEDPSRKVFACQGAACSCEQTPTCNVDADCSAAPNGARKCTGPAGAKHCDCNPVTESCLPDAASGCACRPTPG